MASRKTVNVEEMREKANAALAYDNPLDDHGAEWRLGVASMLETVLHAANRYRGFQYLESGDDRDESRRRYL